MSVFWWFKKIGNEILYSVFSTGVKINGIDEIVCTDDGIYIFDEERVKGDLVFDFEAMGTSRYLRFDKIFSDMPLVKAKVIGDNNSWDYQGKKWISCGRGMSVKRLKIILSEIDRTEFESFRLATLKRAKEG